MSTTRPLVRFAALLVVMAVATACDTPARHSAGTGQPTGTLAFDLAAARRTIQEKNDRFTQAHVAGDVATIDAMFTRDANSFPPGANAAIGPAAIHDLTVEYLKSGITEFREDTTGFYGNADLLIDQGEYLVIYGPDRVVERGKYLNVWKQEDGTWKIHANMWNTSAPPPAAR
jgi:ketosteroid isomerase-like protein